MPQNISFTEVSAAGLESSPHAQALAGLRANEARYFSTKYGHAFATLDPAEGAAVVAFVAEVLQKERGIAFAAKPLQAAEFVVDGTRFSYVFYESGLAVNVMYHLDDPKKRAVGFKLCLGMDVPAELEGKFKFARQKSKLAGEIRGSFFVVKGQYRAGER